MNFSMVCCLWPRPVLSFGMVCIEDDDIRLFLFVLVCDGMIGIFFDEGRCLVEESI